MKVKFVLTMFFCLFSTTLAASDDLYRITVTGKSELVVDAKHAELQFSIMHVEPKMDQSYKELQNTLASVDKNFTELGFPKEALTRSLIQQGIEQSWSDNSWVDKGYYSRCLLTLKVDDISKLAAVYQALSKYSAIQVHYTQYSVDDMFILRNLEYKKALLAARTKAEFMAKTLDAALGSPLRIEELNANDYAAARMQSNRITEQSDEQAENYGKVKITASVRVDFELH